MTHYPGNAARVCRDDRQSRRKRIQDRARHVVDVGAIEEDVCFIVELTHLLRRYEAEKLDVAKLQLMDQRFESLALTAAARNRQLRLRILTLNDRKRPHDAGYVVQRIKIAIRQKDRSQRFALVVLEMIDVDDVRDRLRVQTELVENFDEIRRRHDQRVSQPHNWHGGTRP